jgi:hypothetical protein
MSVDALDVAILLLRIALVALLYLFLFAVLRLSIGGLRRTPRRSSGARDAGLRLVVLEPGTAPLAAGQVINLADGGTLGRADRADLVLADAAVSAEHARVDRLEKGWVVSDLGSTNGTRVNDRPVKARAKLSDGDVLSVGTVRLQVRTR